MPGHEAGKANDGSLKSYWAVRSGDLPADLGFEWREPRTVPCLVIRYYDGGWWAVLLWPEHRKGAAAILEPGRMAGCGDGAHGYVFLFIPTSVEQVAELTLALDAAESMKFAAEEVFPQRHDARRRVPPGWKAAGDRVCHR
jgi:hypothetical protein